MRIEVLLDLKPDSAKARSGMSNSSVFGGWTASTGACSPFTTGRDRRSGTALRRLNEPPARRDNNNTRRTDSDPDTAARIMLSRRRGVNTTMTTINHTPAGEQRGKSG